MMKLLMVLAFWILSIVTVNAEILFNIGSTGRDYGKDLAIDEEGNIILTGYFEGTVDFDPGPNSYVITASGVVDMFLAKFTAQGQLVWVFKIGGPAADMPHTVMTDSSGNIYLTGYFSGQADFDPAPESWLLTSSGMRDIFLAKYSPDAQFQWAFGYGGADDDEGMDVTVDSTGGVILTGYFNGTIDVDPGSGVANLSSASRDILAVRYSSTGLFDWGFSIGGTGDDHGHAVITDSQNNVYIAGWFAQEIDFDPGASSFSITSNGAHDGFLAKYNHTGGFEWAFGIGGAGEDQVRPGGIALDRDDRLYITGDFSGTVDFDPGTSQTVLTSSGQGDVFGAEYNPDKSLVLAFGFGGSQGDSSHRIEVDESGNMVICGWFRGTADFDPGPGNYSLTAKGTGGASDIFIAHLNPAGYLSWAIGIGSEVNGADFTSLSTSAVIDSQGNIISTGKFYETADFDPGSGAANLVCEGDCDVFLAKYDQDGNLWNDTSPTPTPESTETETPRPSATPTPTQTAGNPELVVRTNLPHYRPDDLFTLTLTHHNPGLEFEVDEYLILDAGGFYFFWPSWSIEMDFRPDIAIPTGDEDVDVLHFNWPADAGSGNGLIFWAAWATPGSYEILSLSWCSFSYSD